MTCCLPGSSPTRPAILTAKKTLGTRLALLDEETRGGTGPSQKRPQGSTAVKRLGQFFFLFREISFSFTMKWKHEQGYYIKAVECKCIPIFSHINGLLLLPSPPHPDNIALTNGVNKSEFANFQNFFSKVPRKLVN